jgi:amidase
LIKSVPVSDASLVANLRAAGAIILAKANLSELAFLKGTDLPCGWSAVGGQTQSAYGPGGFTGGCIPAGSSSGCAVGASAGFAAGSVGTDPTGSNVEPSSRAALFGMRASVGLIPRQGTVPVSSTGDTAGPIAISAYDVALLLGAMIDHGECDSTSESKLEAWIPPCSVNQSTLTLMLEPGPDHRQSCPSRLYPVHQRHQRLLLG